MANRRPLQEVELVVKNTSRSKRRPSLCYKSEMSFPDCIEVVPIAGPIADFPSEGGSFDVEVDASGGSYFQAARYLLPDSTIDVPNWPRSAWQIDSTFPRFLPMPDSLSRRHDLGDSIMTAIAMAPLAEKPTPFTDLGRLRVQECERVHALRAELTKCGANVVESGVTLTIRPGPLHGAEIESYGDHCIPICFATLGLVVPGIRLLDPACVKKSFPTFFQKLAAEPPHGLGAVLRDAAGRRLSAEQLAL